MGYTKTFIEAETKVGETDFEQDENLKMSIIDKFNKIDKKNINVSLFQTAEDLSHKMELIKKNMEEYLKKSTPPVLEKKERVIKESELNVFQTNIFEDDQNQKKKMKEIALNGKLDKIIDDKIQEKIHKKQEKDKRLKNMQNHQKKLLGDNTIKQVKNKLEVQREKKKKSSRVEISNTNSQTNTKETEELNKKKLELQKKEIELVIKEKEEQLRIQEMKNKNELKQKEKELENKLEKEKLKLEKEFIEKEKEIILKLKKELKEKEKEIIEKEKLELILKQKKIDQEAINKNNNNNNSKKSEKPIIIMKDGSNLKILKGTNTQFNYNPNDKNSRLTDEFISKNEEFKPDQNFYDLSGKDNLKILKLKQKKNDNQMRLTDDIISNHQTGHKNQNQALSDVQQDIKKQNTYPNNNEKELSAQINKDMNANSQVQNILGLKNNYCRVDHYHHHSHKYDKSHENKKMNNFPTESDEFISKEKESNSNKNYDEDSSYSQNRQNIRKNSKNSHSKNKKLSIPKGTLNSRQIQKKFNFK